jgi:hypothetical protein
MRLTLLLFSINCIAFGASAASFREVINSFADWETWVVIASIAGSGGVAVMLARDLLTDIRRLELAATFG